MPDNGIRSFCGQRIAPRVVLVVVVFLAGVAVAWAQGKTRVPDAAAQAKARELVRDVYGKEYGAAKMPSERVAVARKLLNAAAGAKGDPASHFVLLEIAKDVAVQAGDAETALEAVDRIVETFEVDPIQTKVGCLEAVARAAKLSSQYGPLAEKAFSLIDAAVAADDFVAAGKLGGIARDSARRARNYTLVKEVVARMKVIEKAEEGYAEYEKALARLEKSPTDPDANLSAGRYLCLVKGDWEKGVPMLALGSDEALSAVAREELDGASSAEEQVELGDAWWKLAETRPRERSDMLLRAGSWYGKAKAGLSSGLTLVKVEKRLDEIAKIGRPIPRASTAAKTRTPRTQFPAGAILLMTFEPDTFTSKDGQEYVADMSGFESHGVVTGATQIPAGRAGAALEFSGEDTVLLPTLRAHLTRQLRQLTISVWVSPTELEGFRFIFDVGSYGWTCISVTCREGKPTFFLAEGYGGGTCVSDNLEPIDQWHHVAAVWNGIEQGIYVDAQLKAKVHAPDLILNTTSISAEPARLGSQAKAAGRERRHFQGMIDEVAIFARALSEEEIQTLYKMGQQGSVLPKAGRTKPAR
ncbi:MAG: LamG domain-containing protein [Planctomycetes bacterium]|nr:LamG domain-containing protein [Planctomycetota bacterium]